MTPAAQPSQDRDYLFELSLMRQGPYYDARTKTLRIPHRWHEPLAETEWQGRKFTQWTGRKCANGKIVVDAKTTTHMEFDPQRHEFFVAIPECHAFQQVQKARAFYFALYRALNPAVVPVRTFIVEYATLSDGHARVEIDAETEKDAIAQVETRCDFWALDGCREKTR